MFTSAHMPPLIGASGWVNSEPLELDALRGRVVLVNFWTLTCINWLRQAPYVRAWAGAYRADGLLVLGVHTPEFSFERDHALVRHAVTARAIDYPVLFDDDYVVWSAFANRYWPALYFVDQHGIIRGEHFGEGRYEQSERLIQELLGIERAPATAEAFAVEAPADWAHMRTPETYLGYARGTSPASAEPVALDEPRVHEHPARLLLNEWGLAGSWTITSEAVVAAEPGATIAFRFHARDAHLVLSSPGTPPIPFRITIDGRPPGASHGDDVDEAGDGLFDGARMYQLVRQAGRVRERTLEITFLGRGIHAYVFTFG